MCIRDRSSAIPIELNKENTALFVPVGSTVKAFKTAGSTISINANRPKAFSNKLQLLNSLGGVDSNTVSFYGLTPGMTISGGNLPAGTQITEANPADTFITLSVASTISEFETATTYEVTINNNTEVAQLTSDLTVTLSLIHI